MKPSDPNPYTGTTDNPIYYTSWCMLLGLMSDEQKDDFQKWVISSMSVIPYVRWPGLVGEHAISQDEIIGMIDAFPDLAVTILSDLEKNDYFGRLDRHPYFIPYVRSVAGHNLTFYEIAQWGLHILATAFFPGKDTQGRPLTSGALLMWMTSFRAPKIMMPFYFVFKLKRPIVPLFEIYFDNVPKFIEAAREMK